MMQHTAGTLWDGVEAEESLAQPLQKLIRSAYFSGGGEVAMRYRVSVDDVLEHLLRAGASRMPRPERAADNVRCVIHAAALVRGDAQAWADLLNALAPSFDRACAARLDPVRGIAFARRFWMDLRATSTDQVVTAAAHGTHGVHGVHGTHGAHAAHAARGTHAAQGVHAASQQPASRNNGTRAPDLRQYTGARPMRYWLAERLLGSLEMELGRAAHPAPRLDRAAGSRTLRIPRPVITAEAKAT